MKSIIALIVLFGLIVVSTNYSIDGHELSVPHFDDEKLTGRITNGKLASPRQFPYQAGLLIYFEAFTDWCGGSVIANRWIITAAHCTNGLSGVDVYLGTTNRKNRTEEGQQVIFVPKRYVIVHENWNSDLIQNDISLIKLPVAIRFNEFIQPAKLPKMSAYYESYAGEKAVTSGWGRTSDEAFEISDKLRWIEVPVITNSVCEKAFSGSIIPIIASNICVDTTGGISVCNSDSGGPLVLTGDSNTLIGITSFGSSKCEAGNPAVFARITSYLDWINKHTGILYT